MKIIVTHISPDLDAITSVWLIRKFLPGWNEAGVQFVLAGERYKSAKFPLRPRSEASKVQSSKFTDPVEKIGEEEVIHVDTGLGPLDHHHTEREEVSATSLTWEYVRQFQISNEEKWETKEEAINRIVKLVTEIDHFGEVFWDNPTADYHEFSLIGILEGLKLQKPGQDEYYVEFISECLEALLHNFEDRIWAEKEISQGREFITKWGKGIGFETLNDTVLKLAQKMGYIVVVRKDPRKGYMRVKARPGEVQSSKFPLRPQSEASKVQSEGVDLTLVYEKLKKIDPDATWFLHVSKKMLLNGSAKNPKTRATKLSLDDIINVLEHC